MKIINNIKLLLIIALVSTATAMFAPSYAAEEAVLTVKSIVSSYCFAELDINEQDSNDNEIVVTRSCNVPHSIIISYINKNAALNRNIAAHNKEAKGATAGKIILSYSGKEYNLTPGKSIYIPSKPVLDKVEILTLLNTDSPEDQRGNIIFQISTL